MYPFQSERPFVRDAWYVACWSGEVGRTPMQRTLLEEPIVFYRTEEGRPVALWGLCAHRHYPLAEGRVVGNGIECPYHGYTFDCEGACIHVPGQATPPQLFRHRTYPLHEVGGIVFIWMGRPEKASEALLPPLADVGIGSPSWTFVPNGITSVRARWPLFVDNLLDLSHIGFLHLKTIEAPAAGSAPAEAFESPGGHVGVRRWMPETPPSMPYMAHAFPGREAPLDVEVGTVFFTPAFLITYIRFHELDARGQRQLVGISNHMQGVTPETRHSTHGFSALIRNFRHDDPSFDSWIAGNVTQTRNEDKTALEKIEPFLDQWASRRRELSGLNDAVAIRVRRHIEALLAREDEAEGAPS